MFDVSADHQQHLLRITLRGFWDKATMTAYSRAVRKTLAELQNREGCRRILINMLDYPIQSKEVAEGHAANLHVVKARGEAWVALVMQSGRSKLQAARIAQDTGFPTFSSEAEALGWLASRDHAPAPNDEGHETGGVAVRERTHRS